MARCKLYLNGLLACLLLTGCSAGMHGSGHVVTENRVVAGVNAVELGGVGELTIMQGEPAGLVVEAEDNLLPHITSATDHGTLKLAEEGFILPTRPIRFRLTVPQLNKVVSTGAATVRADKFSSPQLLDLRVEGAGTLEFTNLDCGSLKVVVEGSAGVKVQGRARDQDVSIAGSASYKAGDFRTQKTKIEISGASSGKVWVLGELDVEISGVGSVDYYGSPKIKQEISGVGSLHALGEKPRD